MVHPIDFFKDKRVLITGVCGTIGREILSVLLESKSKPKEIIGLDNNESGLFFLEQQFIDSPQCHFRLADIRDRGKLQRKMHRVDVVFHTAAFKHVSLCEQSPFEAVQTNINGVQNIIDAALENSVEHVLFTSSDKAVNPTNVMGTSKLMGERLMTAANSNAFESDTIFAATRFGNVLGSSGSVVPLFHRQIALGGPVTLTDPNMTRFIMSVDQAVRLVVNSIAMARGGEVLITKMPVIRIKTLAEVMVQELAPLYGYSVDTVKIETVGVKPGEKLYEELMSREETRRAVELPHYFAVLPAFRGFYRKITYNYEDIVSKEVQNPYNSNQTTPLTPSQTRAFLQQHHLLKPLDVNKDLPLKRYWPGEHI